MDILKKLLGIKSPSVERAKSFYGDMPPHFMKMLADGAKMTRCGWCGKNTPVWQPMDQLGFGDTHCHWCDRGVGEYYRDWVLREEFECGCVRASFASGSNYELYRAKYHSHKDHIGKEPKTVFRRSKEEAVASSPRVIMYPDRGGYTGISISPNEARMYAFGRLLKRIQPVQNIDVVFENWKPWMDELLENYRVWYDNPEHHGCHINDVVTPFMWGKLPSLLGED